MNDGGSPGRQRRLDLRHPGWRWTAIGAGLVAVLAVGALIRGGDATAAPQPSATSGNDECVAMASDTPTRPGAPTETTIGTIGQAYRCVFAHYYTGPAQDDRELLVGAFAAFTQELQRRRLDRPNANMPALSGDRASDWSAFEKVYSAVVATLPDDGALREALARATLTGMLAALHDDHVRAVSLMGGQQPPEPGTQWANGLHTLPTSGARPYASAEQTGPLWVDLVWPDSPAAKLGIKPGDIVLAVNGAQPYINGILNPGVVAQLYPAHPDGQAVTLTLKRPATGKVRTVRIAPAAVVPPRPSEVTAKLVGGDLAKVVVPGFTPGMADQVFKAIAALRAQHTVRGLILDLRGNPGGRPSEVTKLVSAFVHGKVIAKFCDVEGTCEDQRTDDSVALLNLPLVALTSRVCASACDSFAASVKDLNLGTLVGTRTAGVASGSADDYLLSDNKTIISLPSRHMVAAKGEIISGIGVAPDRVVPLTPEDVSKGTDPALDEARRILA